MNKDQVIQEIKDLFARYGSGNYVPTESEKHVIDEVLDTMLDLFRKSVIRDYKGCFDPRDR